MSRAIAVEIVGDASSVNRAFRSASVNATKFDRSLGKSVRGAVAGSGVFRGLGRSLAFASGGFLAFEGVVGTITSAIHGAESLSKAQKGLDVAIRNTGGNLKVLKSRYTEIAQGAAQFGVNQADATTALERATVLTGNAASAQRAYQEAIVISKATGKDFNAVLTATAKGQEGVTTSLQRYGILIKKGTAGQVQFNIVMGRFRGLAKQNTSAIDQFNATWQNTEEILGKALLPILDKYLSRLSDWLTAMQRSGRLQHDVNTGVRDAVSVFRALAGVVRGVDKVTGGLKNTLELLVALKIAASVTRLAGSFGLLGSKAVVAESEAAGLLGTLRRLAAIGTIAIVLDLIPKSSAGQSVLNKVGLGFLGHLPVIGGLDTQAANFANKHVRPIFGEKPIGTGSKNNVVKPPHGYLPGTYGMGLSTPSNPGGFLTRAQLRKLGYDPSTYGRGLSTPADPGGFLRLKRTPHSSTPTDSTSAKPIRELKIPQGLITAQLKAQAGMGSLVKADEAIRNYILRLLRSGRLHGKAVQEAYQELASINAELAAQIKKSAASAKKAKQKDRSFSEPMALQIAEARAQALGLPDTSILLKMKRAAERALRRGKLDAQGQIDAWNEIASVNQQLNDSAKTALGSFKEINTRKFVNSIKGLTADQKKALRAKLSQIGPGMTVPGQGVGAYGYQIGKDDRPIVIHHTTKIDGRQVEHSVTRHQQRRRRRNPSQRRGANAGGG